MTAALRRRLFAPGRTCVREEGGGAAEAAPLQIVGARGGAEGQSRAPRGVGGRGANGAAAAQPREIAHWRAATRALAISEGEARVIAEVASLHAT
eukprot:CAMPEP_0179995812 /NCGR_PEP_ID=MMETSP0984-20121128/7279_1 /TAXON_ID=483367 /ORGANISM="non described non described, Strain CCMP 2436" /LENGTH=94 /DNA_ID=CAMNT_0021915317 /DNA_START=244 /DNA_END=523 /DNA_ORIENTATION=+